MLSAAHLNSTHFTDLQLLTHTKWNDDTNKEEHHSFLLLTIPTLASRGDAPVLPPTRREALNIPPIKHIFAAHVSEEGNIISILEAGEIVRSILHDDNNIGYFWLSNYRTMRHTERLLVTSSDQRHTKKLFVASSFLFLELPRAQHFIFHLGVWKHVFLCKR